MERSQMGWLFAGIGLLLAVFIRVGSIGEGHTTSYLVGAALGAAAIGLLIGLVLRFGYVKLIRRDQAVWSPWVLVIAAFITVFAAAGRAGEEG